MRIYNRYIIFLVLACCAVNIFLAFLGQDNLEIYFILNVLVFLIITLLFAYLNPRARRALNAIGVVLFAGFMVIVTMKVIDIITGG
ncbi:MAG: hypothetical protein GX631_01600 [Dehalococcoidales bacterium]|nr:hypothetical protein [Dehalococcoidales bacterium]